MCVRKLRDDRQRETERRARQMARARAPAVKTCGRRKTTARPTAIPNIVTEMATKAKW